MPNDTETGVTRREFVSTATGAAVGTILAASSRRARAVTKGNRSRIGDLVKIPA